MIIPIRCFSCGKPIGHLKKKFDELIEKGEETKKALDEVGVDRFCCRGVFMGHVELIDLAGSFKKG